MTIIDIMSKRLDDVAAYGDLSSIMLLCSFLAMALMTLGFRFFVRRKWYNQTPIWVTATGLIGLSFLGLFGYFMILHLTTASKDERIAYAHVLDMTDRDPFMANAIIASTTITRDPIRRHGIATVLLPSTRDGSIVTEAVTIRMKLSAEEMSILRDTVSHR
jgi:vacuolar-type H+-ATPase subunit I/STV1